MNVSVEPIVEASIRAAEEQLRPLGSIRTADGCRFEYGVSYWKIETRFNAVFCTELAPVREGQIFKARGDGWIWVNVKHTLADLTVLHVPNLFKEKVAALALAREIEKDIRSRSLITIEPREAGG